MDPLMMVNFQRFLGGRRRDDDRTGRPGADDSSAGRSYAAMQRERALHRMILVEMERRGPEATAEELYEELAARWDREHAPADTPATAGAPAAHGAGVATTASPAGDAPSWAAELLEEQRETNRLLRRLLERLGGDRG